MSTTPYTRQQIERAFAHANADPRYRYGVHKSGPSLTLEAKQFIAEVYVRFSGVDVFREEEAETK